jgi:hypothetical protein
MGPDPMEQAKSAREHSKAGFLAAVDMGAEVRRVADSLHEHARRNHFGEGLESVFRRKMP